MRMLATTEQMRELDRTAIEERGIPSLELMENAAREVAQAVADLVGPVKGPRPDGRIGGAVSVAVLTSRGEPLTPEEQRGTTAGTASPPPGCCGSGGIGCGLSWWGTGPK